MVEQLTNAKRAATAMIAPPAPVAKTASAPEAPGDRLSLSARVSTLGDKLLEGAADVLPWAPTWLQRLFSRLLSNMQDMWAEHNKEDEQRRARVKQTEADRTRHAAKA